MLHFRSGRRDGEHAPSIASVACSAGGHNGVRSLIASLGTDQLRRVKVGIGRPVSPEVPREGVVDHVLSAFEPEELPVVAKACAEASALALKQVEARGTTRF